MQTRRLAAACIVLCLAATVAMAQQDVIVRKDVDVMPGTPGVPVIAPLPAQGALPDYTFQFIATEMSFAGKVVKGKPYSAEAVTEINQTLADGNRISRKSSATVYRDSEGRMRREQTITMIGPLQPSGDPPQTITIEDPAAGVHYILDPRNKTAVKLPMPQFGMRSGSMSAIDSLNSVAARKEDVIREVRVHMGVPGASPGPAVAGAVGPAARVMYHRTLQSGPPKTEDLGKQVMEGVTAEGTRITMTIAAGEIGNERPIEIVSERWSSPDLETVVMTRRSDPRMGETVYRLTNIQLAEPPRTLFEVPADYKIEERHMLNVRPTDGK